MTRKTRRAFLAVAGAAGMAGCAGITAPSGTNDTNDGSTTTTSSSGTTSSGNTQGTTTDETTTKPSDTSDLPGKQVDGFENFDRWFVLGDQGKLSASKKDAYAGKQSAHIKSQSGDKFGAIYHAFTSPKDFSNKNFSLAVKINDPDIMKVSVALLAPDRGNMVRMMRTMTGPTDRWLRIDFGATTELRDPDLSKVQEIRIVGRRRDGSRKPVDFEVDDLRVVPAPKKGKVMLTFDDSHISHYEEAYKRMKDYGFPGVEGVIAESVYGSNRLDVGMMREMRDAGWDMASHPLTRGTQLPEFSKEKQERRIKKNKQFLVRKGFPKGARHFLTPQNMRGPYTQDLIEKYHETGFSFGGMPNGLKPTTMYNFGRINTGRPAGVRRMIDFAEKYGQLTVINHHAIGGDNGSPVAEFEAQLEYIDKANVDVVTASDLLDG